MTSLYRQFNSEGTLLYVGVSFSAVYRTSQHRKNSPWYREIANIKIEHYETRQEALDAEILAIKFEKPLYNKIHSKISDRNLAPIFEKYKKPVVILEIKENDISTSAIYKLDRVSLILRIPVAKIKRLISTNKLGHVVMPPQREFVKRGKIMIKCKDQVYVSGKQLEAYSRSFMEQAP